MSASELEAGNPAKAPPAHVNAALVFVELGVIAIAPPTLQSVDAAAPARGAVPP